MCVVCSVVGRRQCDRLLMFLSKVITTHRTGELTAYLRALDVAKNRVLFIVGPDEVGNSIERSTVEC